MPAIPLGFLPIHLVLSTEVVPLQGYQRRMRDFRTWEKRHPMTLDIGLHTN
jgi:hypothetical protein